MITLKIHPESIRKRIDFIARNIDTYKTRELCHFYYALNLVVTKVNSLNPLLTNCPLQARKRIQ